MKSLTCIFCQIITGQASASKVYEDDTIVAFLDLYPLNPGHILIVPKYHAVTLDELDDCIASNLMLVAKQLLKVLKVTDGIVCTGVNLHMSNGTSSGQEVEHAHLHVIPRFENDGIRFGRKTRQFEMTRRELDVYAGIIRGSIAHEGVRP